jgi:pilus assembly protein Flp/PilA
MRRTLACPNLAVAKGVVVLDPPTDDRGGIVNLADLLRRIALRLRREDGATMVEYGLIVALIALVAAVGAEILGGGLSALFESINGSL